MEEYSVAVIGTGPEPEERISGESFAMGYRHANGYSGLDSCSVVACADLVRENAEDFADIFEIPTENVYEDFHEMLAETDPEIVSVCTPPAAHAEIVIETAHHPSVEAIHCEKPMAATWGDSQRMADVCDQQGVQLTFNHQLRLSGRAQGAKQLLDDGTIGSLRRLELARGNLYDAGTHQIDLCNYFNGDQTADWVLGQVDYRTENRLFGAHNENQAVALWAYENGVHGFAATGMREVVGCQNRLVGTEGVIEVGVHDGPALRFRSDETSGWQTVECGGHDPLDRTIEHIVTSLAEGTTPTVGAGNALNTTEIIFASWESVRQRGRVDLPLTITDNPLEAMVQTGALQPEPPDDMATEQGK